MQNIFHCKYIIFFYFLSIYFLDVLRNFTSQVKSVTNRYALLLQQRASPGLEFTILTDNLLGKFNTINGWNKYDCIRQIF